MNKLFRISPLLSVAGLTLAFALACTGGTTTETPPPATPPVEAPPAPAPAAAPAPAPAPVGEIGVPACDKYLTDVQACVGKLPVELQAATTSIYTSTRDAWKVAAANPTAKASLESTCAAMALPTQCISALGSSSAVPATPPEAPTEGDKKATPAPAPHGGTLRPPEPIATPKNGGGGGGGKGGGKH